mgnify:CR=1 FL=1
MLFTLPKLKHSISIDWHSSIRFSFGRYTTEKDVKETASLVKSSVERLREISPLWEMYQDGVDLDKIEWA